jgi:hypothetical protein
MTKALRKATEHLRPNLIPLLQYPDGPYRGETTTLAAYRATIPTRRVIVLERKQPLVATKAYGLL